MKMDPVRSTNPIVRNVALGLYYLVGSHLPDLAFPGGRLFNRVRCVLLKSVLPAFGTNNEWDSQVYLGDGSDVQVGSDCQVNRGCRLDNVIIGNHVMIGPEVILLGKMHRTDDPSVPMIGQGGIPKQPTRIADDVWIGARAIVMPGVAVSQGSIVGAGAVVTKDVPPFVTVAGVPARTIATRGPESAASRRGPGLEDQAGD